MGGPERHCLLICGLTGAGGVSNRGGLLVACWHVCDGVSFLLTIYYCS